MTARGETTGGERASAETVARVDALLRRGLRHYGVGEVDDALRCWREVLAIDPGHPEARDFVAAAVPAGEPPPGPGPEAAPPAEAGAASDPMAALVADAERLFADDELEASLDLFEAIAQRDPVRLDVQGWIEHVRSRLVKSYRERLGDGSSRLCSSVAVGDVMRFNLPAHAGFLLSLMDGETTVGDLVSLSGMDPFEALRALHGMLEAGIVRLGSAP